MIDHRDIFVTEIINRKIGIETTCNKERKSYFEIYFRSLGTMNISVGLCKKLYNNVWDKIYFGYNIIVGIFADV